MPEALFPARILRRFVDALSTDLGHETLSAVLEKGGLPAEWAHAEHLGPLDEARAADSYARLQTALRTYYGRGARSILLRIGANLWPHLLNGASLGLKTQATLVRGFPMGLRRKPALELLARLLSTKSGNITVHTLDLDLLFVDHASSATLSPSESAPICYVTQGLVREALFWAVGAEHDIEETSCCATGAADCKFKITIGV